MGESWDQRSVKMAKGEEAPHSLDFGGCGPIFNARDLCRVHACYPLFKDYPQVIYRRGMESALLRFEVQVVILRHCENVLDGVNMIRKGGGRSDSYVVHVDSNDCSLYRVLRDDIFIDLIHHSLEGRRGVT